MSAIGGSGGGGSVEAASAAKLAAMDAALTQVAAIAAAQGPLSISVNSGTFINGITVGLALMDATRRPWFWFDANGLMRVPGGIDGSNLTGVQAATVRTAADSGLYLKGNLISAVVVADTNKRVAQALLPDGRMYFPNGILAPNIPAALTEDASGRVRINGTVAVSGPDIVCIGDSLTHGVGQVPFSTALATLTGRTVTNYGLGGQTSTEIAARFGASSTYLSVAGDSIPASGSVNVTVYDVDLLRTGAGASMTVYLAGIKGTLTRAAGVGVFEGAYTFTRDVAGSVTPVSTRVKIRPDTSALKERIAVIWIGNNNYTEDTIIQRDILAIIRSLAAMKTRCIILTMLNGDYLGRRANDSPNTDYLSIINTNKNIMRLHTNVVDIQKLLPKVTLTDIVDPTYRIDEIHLTTAGYALVANHIYAEGIEGGLFT